jgi:hypothetical protein
MHKDHKAGDQLKEDELEAQRLQVLLKLLDAKNDNAILELANESGPLSLESFVAHANATSIQFKNANPGACVISTAFKHTDTRYSRVSGRPCVQGNPPCHRRGWKKLERSSKAEISRGRARTRVRGG